MASGITKEQAERGHGCWLSTLGGVGYDDSCYDSLFKKEVVMRGALDYITPMELQVIYTEFPPLTTVSCVFLSTRWA